MCQNIGNKLYNDSDETLVKFLGVQWTESCWESTIKVKEKILLLTPTPCPIPLTTMKESKSLVNLQTHTTLGDVLVTYLLGNTEGCQFQVRSKAGENSVAGSCSSENYPVFFVS